MGIDGHLLRYCGMLSTLLSNSTSCEVGRLTDDDWIAFGVALLLGITAFCITIMFLFFKGSLW